VKFSDSGLIKDEINLGQFTIRVLNARVENETVCKRHRIDTIGLFTMTPQEELFAKFYGEEAPLVIDMDDISLRAREEELSQVSYEARARLSAVINERKKRESKGKPENLGFTALVPDETATEAINAIENRNKRLSKMDKVYQTLIDMGVSEIEAKQMISARNIRDVIAKPSIRHESASVFNGTTEDLKVVKDSGTDKSNPFSGAVKSSGDK